MQCTNCNLDDLDSPDPNNHKAICKQELEQEEVGVAPEEPGMQLYVSLCPIVNFALHVIQSGSDPDGFVKRVRPGWPGQNVTRLTRMTRMTRPGFNAGIVSYQYFVRKHRISDWIKNSGIAHH